MKIKYSLLRILFTFLLLIQITNEKNAFTSKPRILLEDSKVEEVCKRAKKEVREYFETGGESFKDAEYDDDSENVKNLMNIIDGKGDKSKSESIKSYTKRILPMAFFVAFGVINIFIWIVCLSCLCCCKCCCCFCCCGSCMKLVKTILFFVSGGSFVLVFVFSTYGLAATNNIFTGIDSASCAIFKVITETVEGQSKTTLPKWGGISGIQNILTELSSTITNSIDNINTNFVNRQSELTTAKNNYEGEFDSCGSITDDTGFNIVPPTYTNENSLNLNREYSKFCGKDNTGSVINLANNEYTQVISPIIETLENAKTNVDNIFNDKSSITQSLNDASEQITNLQGSFDEISNSVADPWMDNQNTIVNDGKKYAKTAFSIIMVLSIFMIAVYVIQFLDILKFLHCVLKIATMVLWNLLFLFSILSYIVCGLIGLIGIVGKDASSLAHYIISEKNLKSEQPRIVGSGDSVDYLNICVNGDGNLKEKLNLDESLKDLNELYGLRNEIEQHKATIQSNGKSVILQPIVDKACWNSKNYLNCKYYKKGTMTEYKVLDWLTELNKYTIRTNGYQTGSKYYDEKWVSSSSSCSPYEYLSTVSNDEAPANSKKCLSVYDNWIDTNVGGRYNSPGNSNGNYNKVSLAAKDIINAFKVLKTNSVSNDIDNYYNIIKPKVTTMNERYTALITSVTNYLTTASTSITTFTNILSSLLGDDSSIYDIINCQFIGSNFKLLMKQLHDSVGVNVYKFASVMITMTVFLSLALYTYIFYNIAVKKVQDSSNEAKV